MLQGYLRQGLPAAALAEKMADVQRLLLHAGIAPDRKTYSLQLEACIEMDDAQVEYYKVLVHYMYFNNPPR